MSTDFNEKERVFVEGLTAETGRDLDTWLGAIVTSGHLQRNDIIDWLRQQGFTFSRASWLERIHHNGGKLIYGDRSAKTALHSRSKKAGDEATQQLKVQSIAKIPPPYVSTLLPALADQDLETLIHSAKAYRPLAQLLLRDALAAVPGAETTIARGLIVLSHTQPFGAIAPSPKDIRLYLKLTGSTEATWQRAKLPVGLETLAALTHVLVLTDARQITRELRDLIAGSARAIDAGS
jgi:hypothetical protein